MSNYPIRAVFYKAVKTENAYGEVLSSKNISFITGVMPKTLSFKDKLQSGVQVKGNQQFIFARKTPKTVGVKIGDFVEIPEVSSETFKVVAIDGKYADRTEVLFMVDVLELS